jgi:hypothetical protein
MNSVDPKRSEVNLFMWSPFYKEQHCPEMPGENDKLFISGRKYIDVLFGAAAFVSQRLVEAAGVELKRRGL